MSREKEPQGAALPQKEPSLPVFQAGELHQIIGSLHKADKLSKGETEDPLTEEEAGDIERLPLLPGREVVVNMDGLVTKCTITAVPQPVDPDFKNFDRLDVGVKFSRGSESTYRLWGLGITEISGLVSKNKTVIKKKV